MTSTNDGKDVKSNQTSGQKGKSFYIELYKSLDARLSSECGLPERTGHLCEAWRRVHSLCLHSAPATHPHLLSWLQRHTARTILQTEWQSPKSKDEQTSLEQAIDKFIADCETNPSKDGVPRAWESQLQQRGEWFKRILGNPWGHPVLRSLLDPKNKKLDDEQILEWLKEERGVMFVTRLRQLAASKCDDLAMALVTAVMDRARGCRQEQAEEPKDIPPPSGPPTFEDILRMEAGFTVDVWELLTDIELVLLHKGDRRSKCIELAKQTPLRNGYQLVERLLSRLETSPREKKLWKNAKEVATLVAQVIIARCMVVPTCTNVTRTALYCCTRSLVRLLPAARLPAAAAALAAPAVTARHLHTLAQAVDAQCSVDMKPFVCELYVRAITAGMNELERLKLKTEKEAEARLAEQTLSSWFTQLGTLLALSERVRCECTLTAFSVHPSAAMYERIKAAPELAPVALDPAYARGESTSEFGSWTTDSRTQSNLVKTSETLNIKQSQNLANVLSTALLTEGEAIGLSPELCQDLAVLLSGPRVKTLSWDMDREALLESCQAYMERTHGGTRALTTELKYLNLDPSSYQHLPEEENDENDLYYGIEKGYEHLVEVQEPEDVWQDADPERTESACSGIMDPDFNTTTKKKKKTRRPASPRPSTDEDSDPLSLVSEIKKEKKKERPLSKDRSKERKKKTKSKDNPENKEGSRERRKETDGQEKKKRKPRKKKSDPQVEPKPGSLSSLIGLKIANIKIPDGKFKRNLETKVPLCVTDSDYDSQGKSSLASLNSEGNDPDVLFDGLYNMEDYKSPDKTDPLEGKNPFFNSELSVSNGKVAVNTKSPPKIPQRDDLFDRPTPQFSHTVPNYQARIATSTANVPDLNTQPNTEKNIVREEVKKSISKLIEFRRQKSIMEEAQRRLSTSVSLSSSSPRRIDSPAPILRSPSAIIRQEFPEPTDTSPKAVTVPDIPKLYIDKKQIEQIRELKQEVDTLLKPQYTNKPVIQFASTNKPHDYSDAFKQSLLCNEIQNLLNPTNTGTVASGQGMVNAELTNKNFQDFLRELQESINAGTGSSKVPSTQPVPSKSSLKKEIRPISRVTPIVPHSYKQEPGTSSQCAKSTIPTAKKVDTQLNTFARLSYMHKNKQNDKQSKHCDSQIEPEQMLRKIAEEHKASKLKYLYSKGDFALSRAGQMPENLSMKDEAKVVIKKVSSTVTTTSASDHPVLLNMLNTHSSHDASANPIPRQDGLMKNILHQEISRTVPVQAMHRADKKQVPRKNKHIKTILKQEVTRPMTSAQATPSAVTKAIPKKDNHLQNQRSMTQSATLQGAFPRRDNLVKNISHQDILRTVTPKTNSKGSALSEKDQNDLILLLRQQNNLNSPAPYINTDVDKITSKIPQSNNNVTSHNATLSVSNYNQNDVMHTTVIKNNPTESKSNNIPNYEGYNIKKTSDTGRHLVTKIFDCKSRKKGKACKKTISKFETSAQSNNQEIKPSVKNQRSVSKSDILQSPEMKKAQDWASVMDAILKHRTPSRGPNALDMALKKNQNLRNQRIVRTNTVFEDSSAEETRPKQQQTPTQETPVTKPQIIISKSVQSDTVIHKGPVQSVFANVNPKVTCPQKTLEDVVKNLINAEILKRPVHIQKKPYVSELINQKDPFISGIPNSDYDLLEELMDDELKKEIGELSSDEETYRTSPASTNAIKIVSNSKSSDEETYRTSPASTNAIKIVSNSKYPNVINNPPPQQEKHPAVNLRSHLNTVHDARNNIIQPSKKHQTKIHNDAKTIIDSFRPQMPITKQQTVVMDRKIIKVPESMQSCSKNVTPQQSINKTRHQKRNSTKQTYNVSQSVNSSQTHLVHPRNVVITQKVVPKVVLFGSDLVYDALPTTTQLQKGVESQTPYIALNAAPNIIFQTTKYDAAPVINEVITRNAMTVPMSATVIENTIVSMDQKLEVDNTKSTEVAPENLKDYLENFTDESSTHNASTEQPSSSILQASAAVDTKTNMNKNCERKILSEVQDKQMIITEKTDSKITRSISSEDVLKEVNSINQKKGHADVQCQHELSLKEKHVLNDQGLDLKNPKQTKTSSESDPKKYILNIQEKANTDLKKELKTPMENMYKENSKEIERLKKKRIDIINRKVNHLSTVSPIPLGYVPLSKPELTYSEKNMTSLHKDNDQLITETDNATTHKAINDEQIHGKNEKNNSKTMTCRRILLRSPNDLKVVTVSSNLQDQRNPVGRKTKVRLKVPAQLGDNDNEQESNAVDGVDPEKKEEKDSPKRISKRILKKQANNKEIKSDGPNAVETVTKDEIKPEADTVTVKHPPKKRGNKKVIKRHVLDENSEESNVYPTIPETTDTFKVVDTQNLKKVIRRTRKNKVTIKKSNDDAENTNVINHRTYYANVSKEIDTADRIIHNAITNKTVAVTSVSTTEVAGFESIDIEDALQGSKIETLTVAPVIKDQTELVHRPNTDCKDKKVHISNSGKARKKSKKVILQHNVPAEVTSALINSHTNKRSAETETERSHVAINLDINKTSSDEVTNHTFAVNNLNKKNTSIEENSALTPTVNNLDKPIISDKKETNKTPFESVISENAKQVQLEIRQNHLTNSKESEEVAFKEDENKSSHESTCPEIKNNDLKEIVLPKSPLSSSCLLNQSQCVSTLPYKCKRNEKTELIKKSDSLETRLNTTSKCETTTSNNAASIDAPVDKSSKSNESIKQYSKDIDSWKDKIVIEELPITGNSDRKCVRIKLPNGKTFKATVFGKMHVSFESLLADPMMKSTLLGNINDTKRYTVNIKQISTAPRDDPTNIVDTRIEEVNILSNNGPIETVSLLSDDEDELVKPVIKKQTFKTEFGEYNISSLDDDVHKKHQSRFQQKCLLKLTDIKKTLQNDKQLEVISKDSKESSAEAIVALVENVLKKPQLGILENNYIDKTCVAKTPILGDEAKVIETVVVESDSPSLTPRYEPSKDSIPKTIPIMPLDVIEIDDSSNDSTDNILNSDTDEATVLIDEALLKNEISITTAPHSIIEKQEEVIDELKSLLLKDLGVDLVSSADNQENNDFNIGSLIDLHEHTEDQSCIQTTDCFVKLYNCDKLVLKYEKNKIVNQKCFVQLHRCDDKIVVSDCFDSNSDKQDGVVSKNSKFSENGSFLALDALSDTSEFGRNSPVMDAFEAIASLRRATRHKEEGTTSVMEIHRCDDKTVVADCLDSNSDKQDGVVPKNSKFSENGSLLALDALSDTSEFGRNSAVMDAFEAIASLRRATRHKEEGTMSVMDVYELIASLSKANRTISGHTENPKCQCEWYATKGTLQNSAKAESANTLQGKYGVYRLHESTFDSTVASSPIDLNTDKTIPTLKTLTAKIFQNHEGGNRLRPCTLIMEVESMQNLTHSLKRKFRNGQGINVASKMLKKMTGIEHVYRENTDAIIDVAKARDTKEEYACSQHKNIVIAEPNNSLLYEEKVVSEYVDKWLVNVAQQTESIENKTEYSIHESIKESDKNTTLEQTHESTAISKHSETDFPSDTLSSSDSESIMLNAKIYEGYATHNDQAEFTEISPIDVDNTSLVDFKSVTIANVGHMDPETQAKCDIICNNEKQKAIASESFELSAAEQKNYQNDDYKSETPVLSINKPSHEPETLLSVINDQNSNKEDFTSDSDCNIAIDVKQSCCDRKKDEILSTTFGQTKIDVEQCTMDSVGAGCENQFKTEKDSDRLRKGLVTDVNSEFNQESSSLACTQKSQEINKNQSNLNYDGMLQVPTDVTSNSLCEDVCIENLETRQNKMTEQKESFNDSISIKFELTCERGTLYKEIDHDCIENGPSNQLESSNQTSNVNDNTLVQQCVDLSNTSCKQSDLDCVTDCSLEQGETTDQLSDISDSILLDNGHILGSFEDALGQSGKSCQDSNLDCIADNQQDLLKATDEHTVDLSDTSCYYNNSENDSPFNQNESRDHASVISNRTLRNYEPTLAPMEHSFEQSDNSSKDSNLDYEQDILRTPDKTNYINDDIVKNVEHYSDTSCKSDNLLTDCQLDQSEATDQASDISDSILQDIELTVNSSNILNESSNLNCITYFLKDQRETVTETNNTSNNSLLISSQESNPSETLEAVLESNNNSSNCENQDNTEYEGVLRSNNRLAVYKRDNDENNSLKCSDDSIDKPEYENDDSNLSSSFLAAADDLKKCISDSLVAESLNDDKTQNEDKEIVTVVEVIANDEPTLDCAYNNCEKETKNNTSASGCKLSIAAKIESINDGSRTNQDSENENENNDTIERVIVVQNDDEAFDPFINSNVAEIKNLECPSEKSNCYDTVQSETDCLTQQKCGFALQNISLGTKNPSEEINDVSVKSESIEKSPLLMADIKSEIDREIILNGIEYEDPHVGTCYVFPIAEQTSSSCDDTFDEETEEIIQVIQEINEDGTVDKIILETTEIISEDQYLKLELPKITYSRINNKQGLKYLKRPLKRKIDMSDIRISEKKYRKGKNIDYPKITAAAMIESAYSKEFKRVFDYCSSLKISYTQPYHKDVIDVEGIVQNWPLSSSYSSSLEDQIDNEDMLFVDLDNIQYNLVDPMEQSLAEEINKEFSELDFSSINIKESNFNMGFGERSDRVIQNLEDVGDDSKFSAATLSDVKQPQPFLLPEDYENYDTEQEEEAEVKTRQDQMKQLKRYMTYIQIRDKVRSFFKKTTLELKHNWFKEKYSSKSESTSFPFDLCNTMDFMDPPLADVLVQVVQVGQLPDSAAAQNPVTCDPRVTQVSDASPSQCSAENSPQDDSQLTIKTEYTELTTADLSVPMMQEYAQHIQHLPMEPQESTNIPLFDENIPIKTEIKSEIKIELMEESEEIEESGDTFEYNERFSQETKNYNNVEYSFDTNQSNATTTLESEAEYQAVYNSPENQNVSESVATQPQETQQQNGAPERTDQIAHAMNAAGITTISETMTNTTGANALVNILSQKLRQGSVGAAQSTNSYPNATAMNAMALQQALAQILPPPLNQTDGNENNQHAANTQVAQQVLHIVQGKNASGSQITLVDNSQQSVINAPNATPVLHIVQNKSNPAGATSNGSATPQTNSFGGLSLVDTGLQQGGNQLLHIVNTGNQKNNNATGQLLKRVNLLTNLTNVQGSNEQKMVQFVCKSADGKSIQLNAPHQRSMVLRLQPIETPNVQTAQKPADGQDLSPTSNAANALSAKEAANQQEIKSRSVYEENYAKFIQNSSSKTTAGEKSTSLPKFNQAFGKPTGFQDGSQNQNEMAANNSHLVSNTKSESSECQATDNAINLDHIGQISSPPLLLRKSPAQTSQSQVNLVQQLKQTITPMNIQTMHGGVIYTRQIPVNFGGGQTINLITVPSTDLVDDAQKQQQGGQNDIEPSIIKIVPQNQATPNTEGSSEDGTNINVSNEGNQNPQPVLTQMRIKLPMLSKTPQMVSGARVVRPSYFQIQRNVIAGANQPVYQQLVLTAAPPLGQQTIRLPQTQTTRQIKVQDNQSSAESQMSSSTLEQLREFDMVLEQVKERSSVPPISTSSSFSKLHTASSDTTDGSSASSTSTETSQQVLYSIGNSHQPLNVAYVNRKLSTVTTPTTSTFVRSPDSSGIVDSPTSSTHVQIPHTVTTEAVRNEAPTQPKPRSSKSKSRPKASSNPPNNLKLNPVPPKTSAQKPLEDEQTTQRILYILAEYKEQVENCPDQNKPAPRRRSHLTSNPSGSSKRKKSSSSSRRHGNRDMSPIHGEDTCRTMGSEDSSCGTSLGDCNESCHECHSPQDSPRKVVRKLTFEQETPVHQPRPQPQRNVIVADGQTITVARGTAGKPATAVLMPANYILPVSMVKGGQQIAIVTNRGPKLLTVGGGEGGATNALLLQRLIGPAGLKPVLTRPGVRHVRLPTAALQNLQAFNFTTATTVQPPDSTASPAPAPTPPELIDTRATSSPWTDRDGQDVKPERSSSPEGSEPWHLPASRDPHDYIYEETVRADNLNRTVLDPIPDRYSPDMEAQRIFDKMFDVESKKAYMGDSHDDSPRCAYDIDASDCDYKAYHQVVQKKDGSSHRQHRLTHVSAAALRHKYAILEHELRLQKSLSEECEDLGVDSPSASELFPEAELLFATSPAHDHAQDQGHHSHTPQPTLLHQSCIPQPDMDDQIATDQLLTRDIHEDQQDLNMGLEDEGIVTVSEDGMQATIALDHEEFARSHPNTTFHSEPEVGEVQPFTIAGLKGRQITSTIFHSSRAPATVLMSAPHHTVISQPPASNHQPQTLKFSDIDNMINSIPSNGHNINLSSVLVKDEGLTRFDTILNDSRELHLSNTASTIVHSAGNATQVIRRVCYDDDKRDNRFLMDDPDALIAGDDAKMIAEDSSRDATMESMTGDVDDERSSPERHTELFWESNSASERSESRRPYFSSDSEKCCKSPYDETNSTDSSGVGTHMRLDSVIKDARGMERSASADGSSDDAHPPLRTYPPQRSHHAHAGGPAGGEGRSLSGKTRAGEGRRRVVKRGCHCCSGSPAPPRPKKPRQRKPTMDFTTN